MKHPGEKTAFLLLRGSDGDADLLGSDLQWPFLAQAGEVREHGLRVGNVEGEEGPLTVRVGEGHVSAAPVQLHPHPLQPPL